MTMHHTPPIDLRTAVETMERLLAQHDFAQIAVIAEQALLSLNSTQDTASATDTEVAA